MEPRVYIQVLEGEMKKTPNERVKKEDIGESGSFRRFLPDSRHLLNQEIT